MNNYNHRPDGPTGSPKKKVGTLGSASGNWLSTDTKGQIGKDYSNYNQKNMRQSELQSALDGHGFAAQQAQGGGAAANEYGPPRYKNTEVRKTQQQK